jgi:chemotaxis signal transduction protein
MLMLIFEVARQKYALNTNHVVKVLPAIKLQTMHGTSQAIAGVFNYQGHIIPVININQLLNEPTSEHKLQQRIILISQKQKNHQEKLFGLLVEKILEATTVQPEELKHAEDLNSLFSNPYLGETFLQEKNILQQISTEHILSDQEYRDLIANVEFNG